MGLLPLLAGSVSSGSPIITPGMTALPSFITFTRASNARVWDASGILQTVGSNVARFDRNPDTLAWRGLLIEGPATNLLTRSNPDAGPPTGWTLVGTAPTLVTSTKIASHNALQCTGTGTSSYVSQNVVLATNTTYTLSVFVEALSGTPGAIMNAVSFVGATGTLSYTPTVADVGKRVSMTFATTTDNTGAVRIGAGTGGAVTGSVTLTGWQLETGDTPTSYIETGATTATRAAERATGPLSSIGYNALEGTVVCDAEWNSQGATQYAYCLGTSADSPARMRRFTSTPANVICETVVASVATATSLDITGVAARTVLKSAYAYRANDFAVSYNGGAVKTDLLGAIPTVTDFDLGSLAGSNVGFVWISTFTYYPTRLPNAQLQSLSA